MSSVSTEHQRHGFRGRPSPEPSGNRARDFVQSILLLTLAMLAALFSNSAARDGRIAPTVVGAFVALTIAIWVGVRLVPRLAAGVEWSWIPILTRYQLTREGWVYLTATAVVIMAAVNTSNNLLYMILSALLAVIVLSGFLSGVNFRMVDVGVLLPDHCYVNRPFQLGISIRNQKQVFPSFSLQVRPIENCAVQFPPFYMPLVRTGRHETRTVEATLPSRGRYELEAVYIQSRYPFGFFSKGARFPVQSECLVFPEILAQETLTSTAGDILGSSTRFEKGSGIDLYRIRDYQMSDSARLLDWKASAKTSSLKTREFAAEESHRVALVFDSYGTPGQESQFEHLVSQAATMAFYLIRAGTEVGLVSADWRSRRGRSENVLLAILGYLALVEMSPKVHQPVLDDSEPTIHFSLRSPSHHSPWQGSRRSRAELLPVADHKRGGVDAHSS